MLIAGFANRRAGFAVRTREIALSIGRIDPRKVGFAGPAPRLDCWDASVVSELLDADKKIVGADKKIVEADQKIVGADMYRVPAIVKK